MSENGSARCYGYAVVTADAVLPQGLTGLKGAPLEKLVDGNIAIVISKISVESIRPQHKHLSAHFKVVSALNADNDILPVTFGIIFDSRTEAKEVLRTHTGLLYQQLRKVSDCVEMGLRLKWQGVDVFTVVVEAHTELRDMRDRCFSGGTPSQSDLLDIGQAFERVLNEDRSTKQNTVETVLGPVCADIITHPPANERVCVNLACLVPRPKLKDFDAAVEKLGEVFDDNHLLEIDGPLPPFNFVEVRI